MLKEFSGDFRVYRVVMSSSNPPETLHAIQSGKYNIRTFLDMLEMLDVQDTIREEARKRQEAERNKPSRGR